MIKVLGVRFNMISTLEKADDCSRYFIFPFSASMSAWIVFSSFLIFNICSTEDVFAISVIRASSLASRLSKRDVLSIY